MPKRTTTKMKQLIGSDRSDRVKPTIAAQPIDAQPNAGLDAIGRAEYQRITNLYAASGRLTALHQTILCLYASAYSDWRRAEQSLREHGELLWLKVRDTHGRVSHKKPVASPYVRLAATAAHALSTAMATRLVYRLHQG
jgi:phage terminase small subunit